MLVTSAPLPGIRSEFDIKADVLRHLRRNLNAEYDGLFY